MTTTTPTTTTSRIDTTTIKTILDQRPSWDARLESGTQTGDLWAVLSSLERFSGRIHPSRYSCDPGPHLDDDEQWIVYRCLAAWLASDHGGKMSTAHQYGRDYCRILLELPRQSLADLFPTEQALHLHAALNVPTSVRNKAIPALRAVEIGARALGIVSGSVLKDLHGVKQKRIPKVATDEALDHAVEVASRRVIERPASRAGFPKEIRDLALLMIKNFGLRSCEMASMQWGDFAEDSLAGSVHGSKTQNGLRPVQFPIGTIALVRRYQRDLIAYNSRRGRNMPDGNGPLWFGVMGGAQSSRRISEAVSRLLPGDVRPHALRGRLATKLVKVVGVQDVAAVLGIDTNSVKDYLQVSEAEDLWAQVADVIAAVDLVRLGILNSAPPRNHETPCWLPDDLNLDEDSEVVDLTGDQPLLAIAS